MAEFGMGMFFGAFAGIMVTGFALGFVIEGWRDGDRLQHEQFIPFCLKERSALECEALWQGIEVKP